METDNNSLGVPPCLHDSRTTGERKYRYNRVPIFISSSMRDEGNFSWYSVRKELYIQLEESSIFVPFAIENRASIEPSRNYYLNQVERAGIVVALVREELRKGTEDEILHAITRKKPLLLILIGTVHDAAANRLINHIEGIDYCTYRRIDFPSADKLASLIVEQLNLVTIDLLNNRLFDIQDQYSSTIRVENSVRYSIPRSSIAAFGDSSALLSKYFGYDSGRATSDNTANPFLAPLGEAAISWLLSGSSFSITPFLPTIKIAMADSGVPNEVLEYRLKALDSFISKDYDQALHFARQACKSLSDKSSWLYGNCLIDVRNLIQGSSDESLDAQIAVQNELDNLSAPAMFPLAIQFANKALGQTLRSERKFRTLNPNSTIFDSTLAGVLNNLCSYVFVSLLYGSVASFIYGRVLIAHALLDYSELYGDDSLAFEGIRLLVLAGESREFSSQVNVGKTGVSNALRSKADDLWTLSEKTIESLAPSTRCALIQQVAPYFSDTVFHDVESYISHDHSVFSHCPNDWINALDSIKLRMDKPLLVQLLINIISSGQYITGQSIGKIITGCQLDSIPHDSLVALANKMREHASELINRGMPLAAFSYIEDHVDAPSIDPEVVASANQLERDVYFAHKKDDGSSFISIVNELKRQYEENNTAGRYAKPGYNVVPSICSNLDSTLSSSDYDTLEHTLGSILGSINSYQGSPSALDDSMSVLCKFVCYIRANNKRLPSTWAEQIEAIDENRYASSRPGFFFRYDTKTWKTRVRALRTACNTNNGLSYLSDGISLGSYSHSAKNAYLESLEWLISSSSICDNWAPLAKRICVEASHIQETQPRIKALCCLAACSKRWGIEGTEEAISELTRDSIDDVIYKVLRLCKKGSLGNPKYEQETIELLSNDANWFIRWHALND